MAKLQKAVDFLGLKRSIVGLLGMVVLVGLGERMAERFLPLYLIALGGGIISVGALNGLNNLLSALYSFPGGYLAHRLGTKRALLLFNVVAMLGYLIVILIPGWLAVFAGAILFLSWSSISLPATMDLVSRVLPVNRRTMGVSMHSLVRRVPMALGPVIGGACIQFWGVKDGVRISFAVALVLAVVAAIMQQVLIEEDKSPDERKPAAESNPWRVFQLMSPALKNLLVSDILIRFCEQIPYAFVVIWCTRTISSPVSELQFGLLSAIEMTVAALIYVPVAYFADRSRKKPFVVMTFVFFTLFPFVLFYCRSFWPLVGAFILRGLKEFGEPTRKALIMDLSPHDRKAAMFGLYYLLRDVIVSMAAFGGAFLWKISPATNFLMASGVGLVGTVWFALRGHDLGRETQSS